MKDYKWVLVILLSAAFGYLSVKFLTVHPLQMSLYLFLSTVVGFFLIALIGISFRQKWTLPLALVLSLAVFLGSYLLQTEIFLSREDTRPVPELTQNQRRPG